ncbi:hypothetical protein K9M48_00420 [Candidatus Gracilibacteria bacterium]|nr:hypothetical protein [Candidatus Gracilibacteria bacterium]
MEKQEKKPWNDENVPISKNGEKWFWRIAIGAVVVFMAALMLYAICNH